jgi:hypothetical protein
MKLNLLVRGQLLVTGPAARAASPNRLASPGCSGGWSANRVRRECRSSAKGAAQGT